VIKFLSWSENMPLEFPFLALLRRSASQTLPLSSSLPIGRDLAQQTYRSRMSEDSRLCRKTDVDHLRDLDTRES
jgi:hypothetical protein